MGDEVQEGVAAQRAHGQRHQEAEEELEENFVHERDEDDAEQRQQADDGDGEEPADPRCNTNTSFRNIKTLLTVNTAPSLLPAHDAVILQLQAQTQCRPRAIPESCPQTGFTLLQQHRGGPRAVAV